ncbi:MAG: HDOD domain-containing protein [Pseudomonadota bacterium]|nr:HDOD domain-containing protein [Pseudomonadota bacterium]
MTQIARLRHFLERRRVRHRLLPVAEVNCLEDAAAAAAIPAGAVAVAQLATDGKRVVMLVHALTERLDPERLEGIWGAPMRLLTPSQIARFCGDCLPGTIPAVTDCFGVPALVDDRLMHQSAVYLASGTLDALIEVDGEDFDQLHADCFVATLAVPLQVPKEVNEGNGGELYPGHPEMAKIERRLERAYRFPAMPDVATRIVNLLNDPDFRTRELADVVAQDPAISAQVMRVASSSAFAYPGRIDSLRTAIVRVLGYEMVAHIALGMSITRSFRIPKEGPLGLKPHWSRAVFTATFNQLISRQLPKEFGVIPGVAYLSGLLHQFGLLVLGFLFLPEFRVLNKLVELHPDEPLCHLERRILGMGQAQDVMRLGHARLGAWMLERWGMAPEVCAVAGAYEEGDVEADGQHYLHLTRLSIALADLHDSREVTEDSIPAALCAQLGLSRELVMELYRTGCADLDAMESLSTTLAA